MTRTSLWAGLLATAALLAAAPAPAPLCVDAKGHKVFQQSPCPELVVNSGIEPVAAAALTSRNVLETLERFDRAWAKRDTRAVVGLLDEDFKAVIYAVDGQDLPPRRVDGFSRASFINAFSRVANVMSKYEATRSNCEVTLQDNEALAVCNNQESFTVTSTGARSQSREHSRVVLRDGRVLLQQIDQYVTEIRLETQTVPAR